MIFDIELTMRNKLGNVLEKFIQHQNRRKSTSLNDFDNNISMSTQFLQIRKKLLNDLKERLERYCRVLTVFCFNSAKNSSQLNKILIVTRSF